MRKAAKMERSRKGKKAVKEGPGHEDTPRLMPRSKRMAKMEDSDIPV